MNTFRQAIRGFFYLSRWVQVSSLCGLVAIVLAIVFNGYVSDHSVATIILFIVSVLSTTMLYIGCHLAALARDKDKRGK